MTDVFVSYASEDRERVQRLVEALQTDGFSIWWDRDIRPGPSYDREIENALRDAHCVLVVWSRNSVDSEWVRNEVEEASRRNILVPVLIDDVLPPLAHRRRQAANLVSWDGAHNDEYGNLVGGIRALLNGDSQAKTAAPMSSLGVAATDKTRTSTYPWAKVVASLAVLSAVSIVVAITSREWLDRDAQSQSGLPVSRFALPLPFELEGGEEIPFALSPDGQRLALIAHRGRSSSGLYVRSMDSLDVLPMLPNPFADGPLFFSPDGRWIGYVDPRENALMKVPAQGGDPVTLSRVDSVVLTSGAWSSDGRIAYTSFASDGIMMASDQGGESSVLTSPDAPEVHSQVLYVDSDRTLLFTAQDDEGYQIRSLSLSTREQRLVLDDAHSPKVTSTGHLLFARDRSIWAVAFDESKAAVQGEPARVLEDVRIREGYRTAQYDVTPNGTLVYWHGRGQGASDTLVLVDIDGSESAIALEPGLYDEPRFAPDGRSIAVVARNRMNSELLTYAVETGAIAKLFTATVLHTPTWTDDGNRVYFTANDEGDDAFLSWRSADGDDGGMLGPAPLLFPGDIHGSELIGTLVTEEGMKLATIDLQGNRTPNLLSGDHASAFWLPSLSPDGRWIAYSSIESGDVRLIVRAYPISGKTHWYVGDGGGFLPIWSPDGTKLYFAESGHMMSVDVESTSDAIKLSPPEPLFSLDGFKAGEHRHFDLSPQGDRFVMVKLGGERTTELVVVHNWHEELKRAIQLSESKAPRR